MGNEEEPKDLGVKIGTKKEAFLQKVRDRLDAEREDCEFTAELDEALLEVVDWKIQEEQKKDKV